MQTLLKFKHTFLIPVLTLSFLFFSCVHSQGSNPCSSPLTLTSPLPFDTSSLHCATVWQSQSFVLRYVQEAPNVWNFVLSVPNPNAYVGLGFSPDGSMVGSTAVVGWATMDGTTTSINKYFLGGKSSSLVRVQRPDEGLRITNSTSTLQSNQLYLAFQLIDDNPSTQLIFAVGPTGQLPGPAPGFQLTQHRDMISTSLDYATGQYQTEGSPQENLKRSHGILNMLGWGILMPIGVMVARYLKHHDPLWFYSHAIVQSLAFTLGVIGVICGLVLENRLDVMVSKHKTLGIVILVLGTLQVVAILVRPNRASKIRKYWNLYHHNVGRVLLILAAANVFYGIYLASGGSTWNASFAVILVILFIVALILELRICLKD